MHSVDVLSDRWVDLSVGAFEIRIRHHGRTAVAGAAYEDDVEVITFDDTVEVRIDEIEPGCCAPVSQ